MYTLKLNDQEVNLIGKALTALPYGEVATTVANIVAQLNEQKKPEEVEVSND